MREILFRGKDWLGHWHIGSIVHKVCENNTLANYYANSGMCNHIIKAGDYYIIDESGEGFWVSPDTIGEYTGLTDKHGKRIFEGDIVNSMGQTFVVKWISERAAFVLSNLKHRTLVSRFTPVVMYEIVGNIYDALEILKGDD